MKKDENGKMDFEKVLSVLAQPKEVLPPLTEVERRRLDIPYISSGNKVQYRPVRMVMPKGASYPVPLIFVPHYEIGEDSAELRSYLKNGWAVASPADLKENTNGQLMTDNMVFNNAALYTLKHLPEIDSNRIALVGGSAGGYMTLMLHALHLGICGSIANGPITNIYFNMYQYFPKANALNLAALARLAQEKAAEGPADPRSAVPEESKTPLDLLKALSKLPIPFIAALSGGFNTNNENFPDPKNFDRWEAFSPVAFTDWFSAPLMVNHNTSDVLVPIDQITRRFTYEKPGDSLPAEYDGRLPIDNPGKLKYSLDEMLPADETEIKRIPVTDPDEDRVLPFASDKRFQINIFDNGPVEGYGSHSSQMGTGRWDDVPYLKSLFSRGADKTNFLTSSKLRSMLDRFTGESIQLPGRKGIDDSIYGSLEMYRREVSEELSDWIKANGTEALERILARVLEEETDVTKQTELKLSMDSI